MEFSEAVKREAKELAHYHCVWCQGSDEFIDVHHIIPKGEGGPSTIENAAPLCVRCHKNYGDNPGFLKQIRERRDWWWQQCKHRSKAPAVAQLGEQMNTMSSGLDEIKKAVARQQLSSREKEIALELRVLDPALERLFVDGISMLQAVEEPGIAIVVAHVGRELSRGVVTQLLSRDKVASSDEEQNELSEPEQRRAAIASVMELAADDPRVGYWFQLDEVFSSSREYGRRDLPNSSIRSRFEAFVSLLYGAVAPYFSTQEELDELLRIEHPDSSDVERARCNLLRPSQRRYFFQRLKHPSWLKPLVDSGILGAPPDRNLDQKSGTWAPRPWFEGDYLIEIAAQTPELVTDQLLAIPAELENPPVWWSVADVALRVPVDQAIRLVPLLVRALQRPASYGLPNKIAELAERFAEAKRDEAFECAGALLYVANLGDFTEEERTRLVESYNTDWTLPRVRSHSLRKILDLVVPALENTDHARTVKMLFDAVARVLTLYEELGDDATWRRWSETQFDNDRDSSPAQIISAAFSSAERFASTNQESALQTIEELSQYSAPLFEMGRIRILAVAGHHLQDLVDTFIASNDAIEPEHGAREVAALLRAQFENASEPARSSFKTAVIRGPGPEYIAGHIDWCRSIGVDVPTEAKVLAQWQIRRVTWFRGNIPAEFEALAEELGVLGKPPSLEEQELAEVGHYASSGLVGDPSPINVDDLSSFSAEGIVDYVVNWSESPRDHHAGTRRGLQLLLTDLAAGNEALGLEVINVAKGIPDLTDYVTAIIDGFQGRMNEGKDLDWTSVLSTLTSLVTGPDELGTDTSAVNAQLHSIIQFVEDGCRSDRIPSDHSDLVWETLEAVQTRGLPWSGVFTENVETVDRLLMLALNSINGQFANAVVTAALWIYRAKLKDEDDAYSARQAAQNRSIVMLDKLIAAGPVSNAPAFAAIGQFLPQLHLIAPDWFTERILGELRVLDTGSGWGNPIWSAYITRGKFFDSVFRALREVYARAATNAHTIHMVAGRDDWSPTRALVEHVLIGVLRGTIAVGDSDSLVELTLDNVTDEDKRHAYWSVFRAWSDSEKAPPVDYVTRLVEFWEWRITELRKSKEPNQIKSEAKGLGWLAHTPHVPPGQVVELVRQTAILADGELELTDWTVLSKWTQVDVRTAYEITELLVRAELRAEYPYIRIDEIRPVFKAALRSDEDTKKAASRLINDLGEKGHDELKDLLR